MCGIVGILSPNPSENKLQRANELLIHRGPDDSGIYLGEGIGLAIRRLSIIDLEGGHQPISNEDQKIWCICNGEIINAPTLRKQLQSKGHSFRAQADVEVIVHAYEEWGEDSVAHFRGMFAFALWDSQNKILILVRDPFGIKPLFYAMSNGEFAFASEIQPLFHLLEIPCWINLEAIRYMFEGGFIPLPLTAFQGIHELLPAHILKFHQGTITQREYWHPTFPKTGEHLTINPSQASEEFISLLNESIDLWRLSDVPVGSLLSGGIDSASVACLLSEISNNSIHTFNIGFNTKHDESDMAREIANVLGSIHHEIKFKNYAFNFLIQLVKHFEEPLPFTTALPMYLLYEACSQSGFKVILTGEGSDELLAGYHWYQHDHHLYPYLALPGIVRILLSQIPIASKESRYAISLGISDPVGRYTSWCQIATSKQLTDLLEIESFTPLVDKWRDKFSQRLEGLHPLDQFSYIESQTRLPDFINLIDDRMSMAHSVESRPAFLDHRLWDYVNKLPPELKFSKWGNKYILRMGMKGRLPPNVVARPKRGLTAPSTSWWRSTKLPEWVEDYLGTSALSESGYFNIKEVERIRTAHRLRQANYHGLLTGILVTQIWYFEVLKAYQSIKKDNTCYPQKL